MTIMNCARCGTTLQYQGRGAPEPAAAPTAQPKFGHLVAPPIGPAKLTREMMSEIAADETTGPDDEWPQDFPNHVYAICLPCTNLEHDEREADVVFLKMLAWLLVVLLAFVLAFLINYLVSDAR